MPLKTKSNTLSSLVSDIGELSIGSDDDQSQTELPEYDEHSIQHDGMSYKRGTSRSAKRRDRSPNAWYWKHGEEISQADNNEVRWKCEPCWEAKKFMHFTRNSNRSITKHLMDKHNITQGGLDNPIQFKITPAQDSHNRISIQIPSFFNWELLKVRLVEWIVVMHITFSQVENKWFRCFLAVLSPTLEEWITVMILCIFR